MTDAEIYKLWLSSVSDHRYLRRKRWNTLLKVIKSEKLSSVLEFGTGISTILFLNQGMRVVSFETDPIYLKSISRLITGARTHLWNNKELSISQHFDLALVDGANPRNKQLEISLKQAKFVALDDYIGRTEKINAPIMAPYERLDDGSTWMAVFKID